MSRSVFLPVLLLSLAMNALAGYQVLANWSTHTSLKERQHALADSIQQAKNVRSQFKALATELQRLAGQGNTNAQHLVSQLEQQGIRVELNP